VTRRLSPVAATSLGAVVGYLAGTVSFSRLVGERAAPGEDLSVTTIYVPEAGASVEFHGVTATSVKEHAGTRAMLASTALEAAKAATPTLAMMLLLPDGPAAPAAAAGAVVGHVFPAWSSFQGGYGVSPMLGGLLVLDPAGVVVTTAAVSGVMGVARDRRLMMVWPLSVPLWALLRGRRDLMAYGVLINVVYWARVLPELRRGLRPLFQARARDD
jgi:glycerol-3-phosphate acyltransferase PlsY